MDPVLLVSLLMNVVLIVLRFVAPRTKNEIDDALLDNLEGRAPAPKDPGKAPADKKL